MIASRTPVEVDTTRLLWDYYYMVRVPYLQTTSVEYLRAVGSYVTGEPDVDRALSQQWVTTMLPISQMVEYYKGGASVKLVKHTDIVEIYHHVSRHLDAWAYQLQHGLNIGNAPMDDLIAMDRFAHELYDSVKYLLSSDQQLSVVQHLSQLTYFTPGQFNLVLRAPTEPPEQPERDSLEDYFKHHLYQLKRWHQR